MQTSLELSSMIITVVSKNNYLYYVKIIVPQYIIKTYYWQKYIFTIYNYNEITQFHLQWNSKSSEMAVSEDFLNQKTDILNTRKVLVFFLLP